jgi:hypothetical protein
MKSLGLVVLSFALLGAAPATSEGPASDAEQLSTDRRVHGVITSIEQAKITIASSQRAVTGRIDPARTKVTINGHPAKLAT